MGATHVSRFVRSSRAEGPNLRLHVVYTTADATKASLKLACLLARDLGAKVELLLPQVVPYPVPLDSPTTPASFAEELAIALVRNCDVDADVKVLLCRDREETVPLWLPSESIAVIGRIRRWGPGSSWRLIRAIRRNGHHVIVVDTGHSPLTTADLCKRRMSR